MKRFYSIFLIIILICSFGTGCKKQIKGGTGDEDSSGNSEYLQFVSEYPKSFLSTKSNIQIVLASGVDLSNSDIVQESRKLAAGLLKIEPEIKGYAAWENNRTIIFYPDSKLPQSQKYKVKLQLSKLLKDVPEKLSLFEFNFQVIPQNFELKIGDISFTAKDQKKYQHINGVLELADWADTAKVEEMVKADFENKKTDITWEHDLEKKIHKFYIKNIERPKKSSQLNLIISGKPLGISDKTIENKIEIYGQDDFRYLSYRLILEPERMIKFQFSMPIASSQNLSGLIIVKGDKNPRFLAEDNFIVYYIGAGSELTITVTISKGIKDMSGAVLKDNVEATIVLQQEKPKVEWVRKQNGILPGSDNFYIPFKAISLNAVDVTVIEIFEENMIQFMQVNRNFQGTEELKRVGRPVLYKTIVLEGKSLNLYQWNSFNLDLTNLIKLNPGSLYRVGLNFRKSQSLFYCNPEQVSGEFFNDETHKLDWDSPYRYYDENYEDYYYEWEDRENPCKPAYYGSQNQIFMSVLASNLGITAKSGLNNEVYVRIADIRTAKPLSDVDVKIYNYQQQILASGKTNNEGLVIIKTASKPFALVAEKDKERGYLRIDESTALSVSNFDVGGSSSQSGIKGFIYGERGVWRPGDAIYLAFILEDKQKQLPAGYPVILTFHDPNGRLDKQIVSKENTAGIYTFTLNTTQDSPTGNWTASIRVGGEVFKKEIKIETIKPNRLKIDLSFGKERLSAADKNITGSLDVKWLTGAIAKNMRAEFDLTFKPVTTTFDGYPNFIFDDPSKQFEFEKVKLFDGKINENGKASVPFKNYTDLKSPGALSAVFSGRVYEGEGEFSIDSFAIPYYPYSHFVGMRLPEVDKSRGMLLTDTDNKIQIVTVDSLGKPVSRSSLEIIVYKMNWRWWWDASGDNDANYISSNYNTVAARQNIKTKDGKGEWTLRINYPEWGRYFVKVTDIESGHSSGTVFWLDWASWNKDMLRNELGGATLLSFSSDKPEYKVGEKAVITIPAASEGRALISLETGSKIIDSYWVETKNGKNEFKINMTNKMSPNVYVNISLLQPYEKVNNDLPVRLYGVIPLKVVDHATVLNPVIKMPDSLAPEKEVVIRITEKDKRKMAYTLAVVDEGLLDITNFDTPSPWNSFYVKEALGIKTWDMYQDVLGLLSGNFGPVLSIGGSDFDEAKARRSQKANRFKPVVQFFGPFVLTEGKENIHKFIMPNYVGSVKAMVVAAYDGAYGNASAVAAVKESIMVLGTMPRVLGPSEKIKLPVNVFVMDEKIKTVDVTIKTEGPVVLKDTAKKQIQFTAVGDQYIFFDMETEDKIGIVKISILAQSGSTQATSQIELDVRPSNPVETKILQAMINPGNVWTDNIAPLGIDDTNRHMIELSYLPAINLQKRLQFLVQYPHGCIEQTTSSVFPQLYLDEITDLKAADKDKIQVNISAGIDRLKKFRTSSGGFGYWLGDSTPSEWGSCYAGHFLVEAERKGYEVPGDMLSDWVSYQKNTANSWKRSTDRYQDSLVQAYRLYTLALAGKPELGAMNRLKEEKGLENTAVWRLAAAYAQSGKTSTAIEIINNISTDVKDYSATQDSYGSALRDKAMILETLCIMNKRDTAFTLLKDVAAKLGSDQWMSTQETAYALLAVAKFGGRDNPATQTINCSYEFGVDKGVLSAKSAFITKQLAVAKGEIKVTNNGEAPVFVRVTLEGIPAKGNEVESNNILTMNVFYKTREGAKINSLAEIKQGTDIIMEAEIKNNGTIGSLTEIALTQIMASGFEIINARVTDQEDNAGYSTPEYQDIRDDRVLTYFDLGSQQSKRFKVTVNAAYPGTYYLPGIVCESMYNHEAAARKKGMTITIVK